MVPEQSIATWRWRVPYIASGLISLLIYFYRLNIDETHVFNYLQTN
jgi:hypothetical protein